MTDRPILRLPEPTPGIRLPGTQDKRRRPQGIGRQGQSARHGGKFQALDEAFRSENPDVLLRQDPAGIAPERALVFETILPIQRFQKAASKAGFELLIEDTLGDSYDIPEEMIDDYVSSAQPTLYATMPTSQDLRKLLTLWKSYQAKEKAPRGLAPWWKLFEMLSDIRVWGPQDRLTNEAKSELAFRLHEDEDAPIRLEFEIWPTANQLQRERWKRETEAKIKALNGRTLASSSISEADFVYQAILAEIPSSAVRAMIEEPSSEGGIATLDGLQFIIPQMVAQSLPDPSEAQTELDQFPLTPFNQEAPLRVVLLDGTPIAAHPALDGGVVIEDVHGLVPLSQVEHRRHATAMASLILRGDLLADGRPVPDARILSIPILVDDANGASSPNDRLFIDLVHVALARAFLGENALAPEAHLVNFSIGIRRSHFAGKISSLARLLDWWSERHGILFMVSAGNVSEDLFLPDTSFVTFEDADPTTRRKLVENAQRASRHTRTLMEPAEAINVLTVGGVSEDLYAPTTPPPASTVTINLEGELLPAISSGIGLGAFRSIKPDFITTAGEHEIRLSAAGSGVKLRVIDRTQRTGLNVATVQRGNATTYRSRGTSCANALASRAALFALSSMTESDGPYAEQNLPPRDKALITKALSVNAARWPDTAIAKYAYECGLQPYKSSQAREDICRYYGHGILNEHLMREAPASGSTLIGLGTLKKNKSALFNVPLPPSLAGERIGRTMSVSIAWFSPVRSTRARYRLAGLEALSHGYDLLGDPIVDDSWALAMKSDQLDKHIIKRGTVWSRRLTKSTLTTPGYEAGATLPVRVQCRDASGGGLSPDDDIRFAIVLTLEVEIGANFDIQAEIESRLRVSLRQET